MSGSLGAVNPTRRGDIVRSASQEDVTRAVRTRVMALDVEETPLSAKASVVALDGPGVVPFPRRTLLGLNVLMGLFHAGLVACTLVLGNRDLGVPIFASDLTFRLNNQTTDPTLPRFELLPSYRQLGFDAPLTWLVACFFLASATAHLGNATLWRRYYERNLGRCRVPSRFIEYTISATIMILIIAYQIGMRDYGCLLAVGGLIASTMPFGYLTELIAEPCDAQTWLRPRAERLVPYWLGNLPQAIAWLVIVLGFYDQSYPADNGPPVFVHAILWTEFVLFFSFGAVQLWQQYRPPARYYRGEIAYQFLSLIAKGILGAILISQVLVLSSFGEAFA